MSSFTVPVAVDAAADSHHKRGLVQPPALGETWRVSCRPEPVSDDCLGHGGVFDATNVAHDAAQS